MEKKKKIYVTMTDKFMSNWGHARGLQNKLIFICEDYKEALAVYGNAERREEMKYINICLTRPFYYRATEGTDYECNGYYVQIKTKDDYANWYREGAF